MPRARTNRSTRKLLIFSEAWEKRRGGQRVDKKRRGVLERYGGIDFFRAKEVPGLRSLQQGGSKTSGVGGFKMKRDGWVSGEK